MSAAERLAALEPAARAAAVAALDEISRPLTYREIEDELLTVLSRRERRAVTQALKRLDVIAIVPQP